MQTITLRLVKGTDQFNAIVTAVNQGIDSHLEAITDSKFDHCGRILQCAISVKDLPVLNRRLAEQRSPVADALIATIERLKAVDWDEFTQNYLIAALWSSGDEETESFEEKYTISDIHPDSMIKAADQCARFQRENDLTDYPIDIAGHDFWLTRN